MCDVIDLELKNPKDWVEVFPYGLAIGLNMEQPIFIFKDATSKHVLPLLIQPWEADMSVRTLAGDPTTQSCYSVAFEVFKQKNIVVEKVFVNELQGAVQYAKIFFNKESGMAPMRVPIGQALSFCLGCAPRFYTTLGHIFKTKDVESEAAKLGRVDFFRPMGVDGPPPYLN